MKRYRLEIAFLLIAALYVIGKLPTLSIPHDEGDEDIYKTLAVHLLDTGRYTLQGTPVLPTLSPFIYDRPLFHYPPLFACGIIAFERLGVIDHSVMLSWLGHLLMLLAVFLFLKKKYYHGEEDFFVVVLPCFFAATDPIFNFVANKIWIDNLVAGLASLGFVLLWLALDRKSHPATALAALVCALAVLTKTPAIVFAPLVLLLFGGRILRDRAATAAYLKLLGTYSLILGALTLPWFLKFFAVTGAVIPTWLNPDPWLLSHNAFVRTVTLRPWHYFLTELPLLSPVVLPLLGAFAVVAIRKRLSQESTLMLAWFLGLVGLYTFWGARGAGFQMRFLTLAIAPLYILVGDLLGRLDQRYRPLAGSLVIGLTIWNGFTNSFYLINHRVADLFDLTRVFF